MTIRSLDPSGELGKLFFQVQSKALTGSQTKGSQTPQPGPTTDAVDLSMVAKAIVGLTSRTAALPDIRFDRVQRVQEALQTGVSPATSQDIADALIREAILNRGTA